MLRMMALTASRSVCGLSGLLAAALLLGLTGCLSPSSTSPAEPDTTAVLTPQVDLDLAVIQERGRLTAITGYNAISYFIYRGQPMGFELELLQRLADHLDVELDIIVANDLSTMFNLLNRGEGDLIAYNLTITKDRSERVLFTEAHTTTRQVLVQRKPPNWRQIKQHEIEDRLVRSPIDLIGDTVYVKRGSAYLGRLRNLSEEVGGDIYVQQAPGYVTTEELMRRVAEGAIPYTVADQNVARIYQTFYSELDVNTPLSLPQRIAWAVRSNAPALATAINEWLASIKRTPTFNVIYDKYYKDRHAFRRRASSRYLLTEDGHISPYDSLLQTHAEDLNWDWRLLASQVYQESRFDPEAESWAGAVGLMQLMPATAEQYGTADPTDPADNIRAGTRYLDRLDSLWARHIQPPPERIKFVLASYNVGFGHVADARRLAEKYDKDPNHWADVAYYLRRKSEPRFYQDEVVRHGYCRGSEPVAYVRQILARYDQYRSLLAAS